MRKEHDTANRFVRHISATITDLHENSPF